MWKDKVHDVDEQYMEEAEKTTTQFPDRKWFRLRAEGSYRIRILPPGEDGKFAFKLAKHWNMPNPDPEDSAKNPTVPHVCIENTYPEMRRECPICKVLREYALKGLNVDAYGLRIKWYFNALILQSPWFEGMNCSCPTSVDGAGNKIVSHVGVHLLEHTDYTATWFNERRRQRDLYGNILDPIEGKDILIRCKRGKKVSYDRDLLPDKRPIAGSDEEVEKILDQRVRFSDIWKFPDDEVLGYINKSAAMLRAQFENRIADVRNIPAQSPPAPPVVSSKAPGTPTLPLSQPVPVVSAQPEPTYPTHTVEGIEIVWIPHNYKECFANGTIFRRDDAQKRVCLACAFEFECGNTIDKIRTGRFIVKRRMV